MQEDVSRRLSKIVVIRHVIRLVSRFTHLARSLCAAHFNSLETWPLVSTYGARGTTSADVF